MDISELVIGSIKKRPVFFLKRIKEINTRFKVLLLAILTAIALPVNVLAQKDNIRFERLSLEHGLSQVYVYCQLQDSQGFMWFGTEDGLNKYDGYNFTVYRHNPENKDSLSDNAVISIFEDTGGNLWVGTFSGGLNKFDRKAETFTHYKHRAENPQSLSHNKVWSIFADSGGTLWIGTKGGGLNKFERNQETFTRFQHQEDNPHSLGHNWVYSIFADSGGNLWIGTFGGGLNKLDRGTGTFTRYQKQADNPYSLSNNNVWPIFADSGGTLWIGTVGGGLNKFDPKQEKFTHFQHREDDPYSLSHNNVISIFEDSAGILWIGTDDGGLNKFDPKQEKFTCFQHQEDNPQSLSNNYVRSIFADFGGILWIGTFKGLNKFDPKQEKFTCYQHQADNPRSLSHNVIFSIFADSGGTLWIGTLEGLNKFDRKQEKFTRYQHQGDNPHSLSHNFVWSISEDSGGILWIGTDEGLNRFDSKQEKFTHYQHQADNPHSLSHNIVRSILADSGGILWIGTWGGGLNRFDPKQEKFTRYQHQPDNPHSLSRNWIYSIFADSGGTLWIGTYGGGLNKFNRKQGKFTHYQYQEDDPHSLSHNSVLSIFADSGGTLWIGTNGGLNKFDRKEEKFTHFREKHGLPNDSVYGILEDDNGNLWMSTNKGISKFNPKTGTFTNYDEKDGLQSKQFSQGAFHKDKSGRMYFGGVNGFNEFYPHQIQDNTYIPPVVITNFLLFNKPVAVAKKASTGDRLKRSVGFELEQHINFTREITLDYTDYIFAVEFSALNYRQPEKNQYAYKLEGYDKDWVKTDYKNRRATYTNLPHGEYIFRVKATNDDGYWNEEGTSLKITILPPPWKTWWAYTLYVLALLGLFYWFIRSQRRKVLQKQKELERQKLKELDEAKSRFFANISHEFRTPLTLIMGPLEQILVKDPEKDIKDKVHLMLRNSQRLLNLINQLLELARLDSGKMKLEASRQDIVPFLKRVVMCFESLAEQNNVDLIFVNKDDDIMLYFDEEKLEKIITNLLSNAFKYTPTQGSITVTVRKAAETESYPSGCVEISVRDTGTGIPESQLPRIFDRFHRVEDSHKFKQKGSGIGLALTKELVELHHGEIQVKSSCRDDHSRGSEFLLCLPLGKEHLQPEEIVEADKPMARRAIKSFDQTFSKVWLPAGPPEASKKTEESEEVEETVEAEQAEKSLVLVVDDNADVRMYIRGSLEPYFKVVEASDGKEGILRAKEIIPDLVVSDVMMPETDGYELCRTLKNDILTSHIPIILLTAKVSEESELEGLTSGADDYITKPFSTTVLSVRARNLIELRRQLQLERINAMRLQPEELPVSPLDDEFYRKLQDTVEIHLSDPDFNAEALGRELQMSQATLWRKINALTGKTPLIFMRTYRLKRAAQLLGSRATSVSEVAARVGFADPSYFSKCFKEQFNRLPSEFQSSGDIGGPGEETIPAADAAPVSGTAKPMKEVILVVEDSDDARNYIRESLESDYRIVEAADGSEGIARAMEIIPDLVVSDIMMPGTDGHELCRVLKKDVRTSHIPIVLLTAKASEESKIKGLETGADDYVTKPFNTNILRARIKNLIQLRSHLQQKRNREMTMLPAKISESRMDREFMKELNAVIRENLSDPEFNVDQLAKKLYMSSATIYRKIQALSGEVPSEYIRSFRLQRAAQLFKQNFGSITEVAFEVGFNSRAYFTRCFKEKFHQLPSVYLAATSG